jgi:hypothetical protein
MIILRKCLTKTKTNDSYLAKQYFNLVADPNRGHEPSLIIRKLVLTDDHSYLNDHKMLREFKGLYLVKHCYEITI